MESVILVIHLFLALAIIGLVLIQRSEGGGLGIGGGNGGMGGLATARGTANLLTRATAICALCFFCTSLALGVIASHQGRHRQGLLENMPTTQEQPQAAVPAPIDVSKDKASDNKDKPTTTPAAPLAE